MKRNTLYSIFFAIISLFILSACDMNQSNGQEVQVQETDYHISSNMTNFATGKAYHFVITNNGKVAHEFMIMPKVGDNAVGDTSMNHSKMPSLATVENIGPGETKTLDYTFPSATRGSHPEFACYYEGHYEAGMRLDITVN